MNDETIALSIAFAEAAGLPVSFPCDIDPHCGLGTNGLSCSLPALHPGLHDFEDPVHAARVESFLDRQDAARGTT